MTLYERLSKASKVRDARPEADGAPAERQEGLTDPFGQLRRTIHQSLLQSLGPKLYDPNMTQDQLATRVRRKLAEALDAEQLAVSTVERQRLVTEITDDILGYGPLEPFLRDPSVSEIMVNGPHTVYIERAGKLERAEARFHDEPHLRRIIDKIVGQVGRRIDESQPYVDARLPDGSRVNAVIPPVVIDGSTLTVRKFARDPYRVGDLIANGTMSAKLAEFLAACVEGRINILVAGGAGVGKTTSLNVLSSFIPADERIITIEDAAELQLLQPHVVRMESRPQNIEGRGEVSIRDLVRNALRMRPDRIVVGEVRGGEALDMLQAMNTGHDGSMSTIHANSPRDAMVRIETMCLMSGMDLPMAAIRSQVQRAIQLVVHQTRLKDGTRRVTHVTEVADVDGDGVVLRDLFLFDFGMGVDDEGKFRGQVKATGVQPGFLEHLEDFGVKLDRRLFAQEAPARLRKVR